MYGSKCQFDYLAWERMCRVLSRSKGRRSQCIRLTGIARLPKNVEMVKEHLVLAEKIATTNQCCSLKTKFVNLDEKFTAFAV